MKNRKTLFVTYPDENLTDLFAYTKDLAKSMKTIPVVLFLYSKSEREKWDTVLMAAAFGEANMPDTARGMMKEVTGVNRVHADHPNKELVKFIQDCEKSKVNVEVYTTKMTLNPAMNQLLKEDQDIDFVLLSPEVSRNEISQAGVLEKLVHKLSRPFATMTKKPAHG